MSIAAQDKSTNEWYVSAVERLVDMAQELSRAHDLESITRLVRTFARTITGADGASFIMRDGDKCHYVDEDAISPLWKGQRFPMHTCVSGWVMLHGESTVIEDIYKDPRVPVEAYRPTFVKSMVMVPIRKENPIGAIGNYWAEQRKPSEQEVAILQALANLTSIAMENATLYAQLQTKLQALEKSNNELERYAWAVSHDLKTPLRSIIYFAEWIREDLGASLPSKSREYLDKMQQRILYMDKLLNDIRDYSRIEYQSDTHDAITGDAMLKDILMLVDLPQGFTLQASDGFRKASLEQVPLRQIMYNLIDNAIRHHDKKAGKIEIDIEESETGYTFSVRDDGPGVPDEYQQKIFEILTTLKPKNAQQSGMGLAFIRKTLDTCGGSIKVISTGRGSTFRFTWPKHLKDLPQNNF